MFMDDLSPNEQARKGGETLGLGKSLMPCVYVNLIKQKTAILPIEDSMFKWNLAINPTNS